MIKRDYDEEDSGNTETHLAVDIQMKHVIDHASTTEDRNAYEEGFASASGIRPETAESEGRIKHPEDKDAPLVRPVDDLIDRENAGLADS